MSQPDDLRPGPATRGGRREVLIVLILFVALIVGGGLYVAIFGSPTRGRAAVDASSSPVTLTQPAAVRPGTGQPGAKPAH